MLYDRHITNLDNIKHIYSKQTLEGWVDQNNLKTQKKWSPS